MSQCQYCGQEARYGHNAGCPTEELNEAGEAMTILRTALAEIVALHERPYERVMAADLSDAAAIASAALAKLEK